MSDSRKYAQLQPFTLAGSGAVVGATSIVLSSFDSIDGDPLAMTDFGTKAYMTLEPGSLEQEEQISFTGVTQNANGTATLTGVSNVGFLYPYTETSGLLKSHGGGVAAIVSNTSGFYDGFTNKNDDETIVGDWTFDTTPQITNDPVANLDAANKEYVDSVAVSGAPNANETTKGIVQLATNAQMGTGTSVGSTGARLVPPNSQLVQTSAGAGDANKLPTLGGAGTLDSSFLPVAPISKGGTGQTTQTAAFNALSPSTTKGDLIVNDGTNDVRLAVGSNQQILIADSTQTDGVKWGTVASANGVSVFAKSVATTTVTNTVTESPIFTLSVPANTLGTTGVLKGSFYIDAMGVTTVTTTITVRCKYGGSTFATLVMLPAVGGASASAWFDFIIQANGSASSQVCNGSFIASDSGDFEHIASADATTLSINSALTENIQMTVQYSAATTSSDTLTLRHYVVTLF